MRGRRLFLTGTDRRMTTDTSFSNARILEKRLDELERRVRDLEVRPVYIPAPYYVPSYPFPPYGPGPAYPMYPIVTC